MEGREGNGVVDRGRGESTKGGREDRGWILGMRGKRARETMNTRDKKVTMA